MRLTRVEFNGFKRLAQTSCNMDGRQLAILGPNEAGKSSLLQGLAWLRADDGQPLPSPWVTRGHNAPQAKVVAGTFHLDDDDKTAIAALPLQEQPTKIVVRRNSGGRVHVTASPAFARQRGPFNAACTALEDVRDRWGDEAGPVADTGRTIHAVIDEMLAHLTGPEEPWSEEVQELAKQLLEWLREPLTNPTGDAGDEPPSDQPDEAAPSPPQYDADDLAAADTLQAAVSAATSEHPGDEATRILLRRLPKVLLFDETNRVLETEYDLNDEAFRDAPPKALVNLLSVGDTTVAKLWALMESGDVSRMRTEFKRVNRVLLERLQPRWNQSDLSIRVEPSGTRLQVLIDELDDNCGQSAYDERSDGLKAFLALVVFLLAAKTDVLPIVLIDELETHLHYDAQADLLAVLQSGVEARQVIYTTHSPGCLPLDLGTGVRFVAPDPQDRSRSVIRCDFWNSNEPGFSPLLFAMGATAAAFSVCRRAVLAEGPSEMILLPTMLRLATGAATLDYQVAPGLATVQPGFVRGGEVAAKLAYLVDGDLGGKEHADHLIAAGVLPHHIKSLPKGVTLEDLLEPACFLRAVTTLVQDAGHSGIGFAAPDGTRPIWKAVEKQCEALGIACPGKVAIASYLVQDPTARIQLRPRAVRTLRALHDEFMQVLAPLAS